MYKFNISMHSLTVIRVLNVISLESSSAATFPEPQSVSAKATSKSVCDCAKSSIGL